MTLENFRETLEQSEPPEDLPPLLQALWYDRKGNWERAHQIAQDVSSWEGSWVHAYLHRKEGDLGNAAYWYRRANRPPSQASLESEWEEITGHLLGGRPAP